MTNSERERIAVLETQHEHLMKEMRALRQDATDYDSGTLYIKEVTP